MSWPRDDAKLDRVRALMAEHGLDALVVRAPDNVLYLTNFWGMKGYDAVVFPREGEPTLICLEPSRRGRRADGVDDRHPALRRLRRDRPAPAGPARARPRRRDRLPVRGRRRRAQPRHAGLRPHGRRADDVPEGMVRRLSGARQDATPLLVAGARREDRAGGRADAARERHRRRRDGARPRRDPPGDDGGAGRGRVARLRPRRGHRLAGQGRARARLRARLVGPGDQDVHGDLEPAGRRGRADALRDLGLRRRLLVRPHEEPRARRAARRATASSRRG